MQELLGTEETPDLGEFPVDDGVDAHELRPAVVRGVEEGEVRTVRVGASGADEDGADVRAGTEVGFEGVADGDFGGGGGGGGRGAGVGGDVC